MILESRRYAIFELGSDGKLFGEYDTIIGPAKQQLVHEGFMGFFMQRLREKWKHYAVFAAPVELDVDALEAAAGLLTIQYWTTCEEPQFQVERILRRLFPEFDDVMEVFDENKINFRRITGAKTPMNPF